MGPQGDSDCLVPTHSSYWSGRPSHTSRPLVSIPLLGTGRPSTPRLEVSRVGPIFGYHYGVSVGVLFRFLFPRPGGGVGRGHTVAGTVTKPSWVLSVSVDDRPPIPSWTTPTPTANPTAPVLDGDQMHSVRRVVPRSTRTVQRKRKGPGRWDLSRRDYGETSGV